MNGSHYLLILLLVNIGRANLKATPLSSSFFDTL